MHIENNFNSLDFEKYICMGLSSQGVHGSSGIVFSNLISQSQKSHVQSLNFF